MTTWREFLGRIIEEPQTRREMADTLGVSPVTLSRWASGETTPYQRTLLRLAEAVPKGNKEKETMKVLIQQDYPELDITEERSQNVDVGLKEAIPATYYKKLLESNATVPLDLRFWTMSHLLSQQLLGHMDTERIEVLLSIFQCTAPAPPLNKVRSLHLVLNQTLKKGDTISSLHYLAGIESLPGQALLHYQPTVITREALPALFPEPLEEALVCTIQRSGLIAGCLTLASPRAGYFTPVRIELAQSYANLVVLCFQDRDFVSKKSISLAEFPSANEQREVEKRNPFASRFLHLRRSNADASQEDLEQEALQQLEQELILQVQGG